MTDKDIIERAVHWAESYHEYGEGMFYTPTGRICDCSDLSNEARDGLAAQLVRQIDAMAIPVMVMSYPNATIVVQPDESNRAEGPDRTDSTLRACVAFYDNLE